MAFKMAEALEADMAGGYAGKALAGIAAWAPG